MIAVIPNANSGLNKKVVRRGFLKISQKISSGPIFPLFHLMGNKLFPLACRIRTTIHCGRIHSSSSVNSKGTRISSPVGPDWHPVL